jgi:hypothetical protein
MLRFGHDKIALKRFNNDDLDDLWFSQLKRSRRDRQARRSKGQNEIVDQAARGGKNRVPSNR